MQITVAYTLNRNVVNTEQQQSKLKFNLPCTITVIKPLANIVDHNMDLQYFDTEET